MERRPFSKTVRPRIILKIVVLPAPFFQSARKSLPVGWSDRQFWEPDENRSSFECRTVKSCPLFDAPLPWLRRLLYQKYPVASTNYRVHSALHSGLHGGFQGLWIFPKMKTERFGGQPERSVFPVWVLTGFACYSARKPQLSHAVFRKCIYTCCACSSSNDCTDSFSPQLFFQRGDHLADIGLRCIKAFCRLAEASFFTYNGKIL